MKVLLLSAGVLVVALTLAYGTVRFVRRVRRLKNLYVLESRKSLLRQLMTDNSDLPVSCAGFRVLYDSLQSDAAPVADPDLQIKNVLEGDVPRMRRILDLAAKARISQDLIDGARADLDSATGSMIALARVPSAAAESERRTIVRSALASLCDRLAAVRTELGGTFSADLRAALADELTRREDRFRREKVRIAPIRDEITGSPVCQFDPADLETILASILDVSLHAMRGCENRVLSLRMVREGDRLVLEIADTGGALSDDLVRFRSVSGNGLDRQWRNLNRPHTLLRSFGGTLALGRGGNGSGNVLILSLPSC